MKTVRFKRLVSEVGAPRPHPLWQAPNKDVELRRAQSEHRVLTVHQNVQGRTVDHATVGFEQEPNAQYLVFPASLEAFRERRIIGIDYALLAPEPPPPPAAIPAPAAKSSSAPSRSRVRASAPPRSTRPPKPSPPATPPPPAESAPPAPPAPASAEPPSRAQLPAQRTSHAVTLRSVKKALQELKAGKTVAAYERLQSLVVQLERPARTLEQ